MSSADDQFDAAHSGPPAVAWPAAIAVVAIVLGAGALLGGRNVAIAFLSRWLTKGPGLAPAVRPAWFAVEGWGSVLGVVLIVSGILLLLRRTAGRTCLIVWALLAIATHALVPVLYALGWVAELPGPVELKAVSVAAMIQRGLLGAFGAVFLLVCAIRGLRADEMRRWRASRGQPERLRAGSVWPGALGLLAVYRALSGVLARVCSLAWIPVLRALFPESELIARLLEIGWGWGAVVLLWLALLVLHLIAGIGLLLRRRWGAVLVVIYAGAALLAVAAWRGLVMRASLDMAGAHGPHLLIANVVGLLVWAAWPVFVLVWFARGKVREQVRAWPT